MQGKGKGIDFHGAFVPTVGSSAAKKKESYRGKWVSDFLKIVSGSSWNMLADAVPKAPVQSGEMIEAFAIAVKH